MINLLIYIILLCILESILFFDKALGINTIIFMIPLIIFLVYALKSNKKINNKKGLFLIIPIILLSCSYFIYDNTFFKIFNQFVIIGLLTLMYIYTINSTDNFFTMIKHIFKLLFFPISKIGNVFRIIGDFISKKLHFSSVTKKKIESIIVIIPIIIIVLLLLGSADMVFGNIFNSLFNFLLNMPIENIIVRIIIIFILFIYMSSVMNYLLFSYKKETKKEKSLIEGYTVKILLSALNIIYIVFDIIQIRSLVFHRLSESINYAEYARSGFFQLMFISIINITILLISKKTKNKEYNKYNNIMSIIMVILTFIIILSSTYRMYMYECAYGYTLLRLLVYVILFTEIILLIPTIIYIFKPSFKILKYYLIIIITSYCATSLLPVDYIIAKKNINRYYKNDKLDLKYLKNYSTDNIDLLMDLCEKTDDPKIKCQLRNYFSRLYREIKNDDILEYNISRNHAYQKLKPNKK